MTSNEMRHPGVPFPPPILFVLGMAGGWALATAVPLPLSAILPSAARVLLGWACLLLAFLLLAWPMLTFARARTAIFPNRPARAVVTHGPFRYSRNPM